MIDHHGFDGEGYIRRKYSLLCLNFKSKFGIIPTNAGQSKCV